MFSSKNRTSISYQLLKGLLIPLSTMLLLTTVVAYNMAASFANGANDRELLNAAHAVAARLTEDKNGLVAELPKPVQAVFRHNDRDKFFYQVLDVGGTRLAGDAVLPMPITDTDTDIPRFRNSVVNGMEVRMARVRSSLHGKSDRVVVVQVARTLNARKELLRQIFLSIVIPQLVLGLLSVVAVWLSVRRGLRPLLILSQDISKRSQHDLQPIDDSTAPSEIVPIIVALNSLLSRLDSHMAAQQRFISNAAHQLRTPVAGLKAYIEYGRRVNNGKMKDVLSQLDEGTDRISEMVTRLLVLARAGEVRQKQPVDLNQLASKITSMLVPEATNRRIDLTFESACDRAIIQADETDMQDLISNVVVNAIRYTQPEGSISVRLKESPLRLEIEDNGPGIPPDERERVFERFYRVLGTNVAGSGLGLAIVREIAERHNARAELLDPPGGKGTLMRVTFDPV
jgi:two-component system sensor histidine kinase TctE